MATKTSGLNRANRRRRERDRKRARRQRRVREERGMCVRLVNYFCETERTSAPLTEQEWALIEKWRAA